MGILVLDMSGDTLRRFRAGWTDWQVVTYWIGDINDVFN